MARMARVVVAGEYHYIRQKSVKKIFASEKNREFYISLLKELGKKHRVKFHSYSITEREIHLIAVPKEQKSLARVVGEAQRRFSRKYNSQKRVKKIDLFTERFSSCPMSSKMARSAAILIERAPQDAGLCKSPFKWAFSSAAYNAGVRKKDLLIESLSSISCMKYEGKKSLKKVPEEAGFLMTSLSTGRPCGDKRYIEKIEKKTGRCFALKSPGRPRKVPAEAAKKTKARKKKG